VLDLTPAEWTAVALSLRIAVVATACALPFGIAIGWLLARKQFWGKTLLDGLVHLPASTAMHGIFFRFSFYGSSPTSSRLH